MEQSVTTRIKLPAPVHRDVKAEAARHGVRLDEALGMCVAYLAGRIKPLIWLDGEAQANGGLQDYLDTGISRFPE